MNLTEFEKITLLALVDRQIEQLRMLAEFESNKTVRPVCDRAITEFEEIKRKLEV